MGSYLLKQSKLRADEIVHYAYQFAHEYDREYGSPGFGHSFLPQDELRRIITDKAMNSIPNCDTDSAFRVAISAEKILETMGITVKVAMDAVSEELNKPVNALDPQRDIGGEAVGGEQSPANSMADEGLSDTDTAYWHPFGLGMGTEPENVRYGSSEKRSHEEVDYESPSRHEGQTCEDCTMFLPPGACTGVVSPIKAGDWCHEFTAKKKGFTSSLLQITAAPKCPHCGSTDYGLMPSDFETAKCNKCGKNWDHGIVPGVNDPSEKSAAGRGSGIRGDEAVNFYKPTTTLPPRYDQRTHIDKNNLDNPVIDDMKADKKKMEGPTPATGHAPLREDLAQRNFRAARQTPEEQIIATITAYLDRLDTITEQEYATNAERGERARMDEALKTISFDDLSPKLQFIVHVLKTMERRLEEHTTADFFEGIADDLRVQLRKELNAVTPQDFGKLFAAQEDDDQYWLDMVDENEANAKKRFMESSDIAQIAQDNGWTMEQAWDEVGTNFANELYDPRNRLLSLKKSSLDANRPNAEAYNEFEASRAMLNHLVTGEFARNLSSHLMSRLQGIYDEMELLSKDWNAAAGAPPEAHPYDEPEREEPQLPS